MEILFHRTACLASKLFLLPGCQAVIKQTGRIVLCDSSYCHITYIHRGYCLCEIIHFTLHTCLFLSNLATVFAIWVFLPLEGLRYSLRILNWGTWSSNFGKLSFFTFFLEQCYQEACLCLAY